MADEHHSDAVQLGRPKHDHRGHVLDEDAQPQLDDRPGERHCRGRIVQKTSGFTGCTNETFAVTLSLIDVATNSTAGGTGSFVGQLTHHRTIIFGACRTYFATISGVVTLSY